ncbi:MAG: hypothetical protein K2O89_01405 [Clostridia bacterium]|nr:hypothetical protein [Clostridia bacterium]
MAEQNNGKKSHGFLTFIIVILILGGVVFGLIKFISCIKSDNTSTPYYTAGTSGSSSGSGSSTPQLFSRSANNGDVSIEHSENIATLSDEFRVKPNVDIKNLQLTFKFYDNNTTLIKTIVRNLGNVSKGIEFTVSISLTEFSFTDLFKISQVSFGVTGGTVSYLA